MSRETKQHFAVLCWLAEGLIFGGFPIQTENKPKVLLRLLRVTSLRCSAGQSRTHKNMAVDQKYQAPKKNLWKAEK